MKMISSAAFRKTYPRLTETVAVTANGHVIGRWTPTLFEINGVPVVRRYDLTKDSDPAHDFDGPDPFVVPVRQVRQAQRDAILRKINKGG